MYQTTLLELARSRKEIGPDAWLIPNWLPEPQQSLLLRVLQAKLRENWYIPKMKIGTSTLGHPIACFGLQWKPYEYFEPAVQMPKEIILLAQAAIAEVGLLAQFPNFIPDTAIVNKFSNGSSLGMHQDKSEEEALIEQGCPIITVSLGNNALFRMGNCQNTGKPYEDVILKSGDLLIFWGNSRLAYHGILKVIPSSGPLDFPDERLSVTIRRAKL